MDTPTTPEGLTRYDGRPAAEAVARAWLTPGSHPEHHARAQEEVRRAMPLLARALDRLAVEQSTPPGRIRPQRLDRSLRPLWQEVHGGEEER